MDQRDIETFLTLADELHFSRTAARLHLSTARVSQTIKKMERQIGAPLFERTSRRVELTPIGRRLGEDLRPAYQLVQDAIDRAVAAANGMHGRLRVGFVSAAAGQFVLDVAESFRADHPGCEIQLRENWYSAGLDHLRRGEVDMVLAVTAPTRHAHQPDLTRGRVLFEEGRLLAVSAVHPLTRRSSVSFADLALAKVLGTPPAIPDYWDQALVPPYAADGRPAERGPAFDTIEEMFALVGAGMGTFPVPTHAASYYARPDVAYVPIHDAPPFKWRFIWLTAARNDAIRAFDEAAVTLAKARGS